MRKRFVLHLDEGEALATFEALWEFTHKREEPHHQDADARRAIDALGLVVRHVRGHCANGGVRCPHYAETLVPKELHIG
jgi:hypothetical protein